MKILHVCPLYFPSLGGNEIHIQAVSEALAKRGHEVYVFTSAAYGRSQLDNPDQSREGLKKQEIINDVNVRRFSISYLRHKFMTNLPTLRGGHRFVRTFIKDGFEYWRLGPCVRGMKGAIAKLKPDVMLAVMENSFTTYICYQVSKRLNIPFVFMPITHIADENNCFQKFIKEIYNEADLIIACTDFEKKMLVDRGVVEEKINVLPLGLSLKKLKGAGDASRAKLKYGIKEAFTVSYIGRQDFHKGIETLIQSMKVVWKHNANAQLLLAGKVATPFQKEIEKQLSGLTEEEKSKTIIVGLFDEDEKEDLYAVSDVVVMASKVDCFGLVYLESWASEKPVIACHNTPQETIIDDGQNGLLVEYGNAEDTANKIMKLMNDEQYRQELGQNGKEKFKKEYNLDDYALRSEKTYKELMNDL